MTNDTTRWIKLGDAVRLLMERKGWPPITAEREREWNERYYQLMRKWMEGLPHPDREQESTPKGIKE
jgi:hypothetical protein